tara:strand:+ start:5818 stop:6342 length:525 start_codon:yes stop_codon:yes gene_type:complete
MATVYDIIKGINQAAANAYDGSQYGKYCADGEDRTIGLRREQGDAILDSRVMDGFRVRISGPKLIVSYQSELALKEFHNSKLDGEIEQIFADIAKFLKTEYKSITKESLSLTEDGPADIMVQNMSRIRTWTQATKVYTIGGMGETKALHDGNTPEERFKEFLSLSSDKKPENVA